MAEQLQWHQQQLARAQEEIGRLRPAEAQFQAITNRAFIRAEGTLPAGEGGGPARSFFFLGPIALHF